MVSEAQKQAQKKYDSTNRVKYTLHLNYNTDANLISFLESCENKQGTIKDILSRYIDSLTRSEI